MESAVTEPNLLEPSSPRFPIPTRTIITFSSSGYFEAGFKQHRLIEESRDAEFEYPLFSEADTLVGTGISGALAVPLLAFALDKTFALVRKHHDESSHSSRMVQGSIGKTWVFVDDFVGSGATLSRVRTAVTDLLHERSVIRKVKFLGVYEYNYHRFVDLAGLRERGIL